MLNIHGILLDIDNTLYEYEPTQIQAWNKAKEYLSKNFKVTNSEADRLLETAKQQINATLKNTAAAHNRLLQFQKLLELLSINPMPHAWFMETIYWDAFVENMHLNEGVIEFLKSAKRLNKKICFVTDLTAQIQYRKIHKLKLFDYADAIVTSEEAGQDKPHPDMFLFALKKINLPASQTCMIGDNYSKDIEGALQHGIKSYWLSRELSKKANPHELVVEFKNFRELLNFLK